MKLTFGKVYSKIDCKKGIKKTKSPGLAGTF